MSTNSMGWTLMAGGKGFKIYSHDGDLIIKMKSRTVILIGDFQDHATNFQTVMNYVNLKYMPLNMHEQIKNNFQEVLK